MKRAKRAKPRLPVEAVLRTGGRPQTTKKGKRGYARDKARKDAALTIKDGLDTAGE